MNPNIDDVLTGVHHAIEQLDRLESRALAKYDLETASECREIASKLRLVAAKVDWLEVDSDVKEYMRKSLERQADFFARIA